jgi:membrane protease subunit HflK
VVLSLLTAVTQVQPGERAVVFRFGRVLDEKPGPGLHVGLPWGMDRVERVQVDRLRRVTVGFRPEAQDDPSARGTPPGQLLTGDHNLVDVQVVLDYSVRPEEVERFVLYGDGADGLVARSAEAALAEWAAGQAVDELRKPLSKQTLPLWLVAETQRRLEPYRLGVAVQTASVTHLLPPRQVKDAFEAVSQAKAEKETQINQARQYHEQQVQQAKANAASMAREAGSYAREQRLQALAEAENFGRQLEQYRRLGASDGGYVARLWEDWRGGLLGRMRAERRLDLLDHHIGKDGLDITQIPALPRKR